LPGDFIGDRPVSSFIHPAGLPITTSSIKALRRPVESAQYVSDDYTQQLDDARVLASVGSVGDAYDNALAESFVDSFKTELIRDRVWRSTTQLELAIVEYVAWFNTRRLHSSIGNRPPSEHEAEWRTRNASHPKPLPPPLTLVTPNAARDYDPCGVVSDARS
jgi:transposase InsO family protein